MLCRLGASCRLARPPGRSQAPPERHPPPSTAQQTLCSAARQRRRMPGCWWWPPRVPVTPSSSSCLARMAGKAAKRKERGSRMGSKGSSRPPFRYSALPQGQQLLQRQQEPQASSLRQPVPALWQGQPPRSRWSLQSASQGRTWVTAWRCRCAQPPTRPPSPVISCPARRMHACGMLARSLAHVPWVLVDLCLEQLSV
jgi:hypothetical protein